MLLPFAWLTSYRLAALHTSLLERDYAIQPDCVHKPCRRPCSFDAVGASTAVAAIDQQFPLRVSKFR
jgi:hypothetical protein